MNSSGGDSVPIALPQTTDLVIRNDIAELARVCEALERIGAECAIAARPLMQLQVVVDEMASNVIKYAWPECGTHDIQVRITVNTDEVKIEIEDDGRTFNPLHARPPERPGPGQKPRPGGLGIHMVKQLVDAIEFERIGERNHLTLIKRCAVGVPPR